MASPVLRSKNGPFKYDVYLGFGVTDLPRVHCLQEKLEQCGIVCYPKYNAALLAQSVQTAITEGVARSRKCLLYISQSFTEDLWDKFEVTKVLNKVKRFGCDVLIILKDSQLADMPYELNGCHVSAVVDAGSLEDPAFVSSLATELKKGR